MLEFRRPIMLYLLPAGFKLFPFPSVLSSCEDRLKHSRRDSDRKQLPPNPRSNTTLCPHCHHHSCPWLGTHINPEEGQAQKSEGEMIPRHCSGISLGEVEAAFRFCLTRYRLRGIAALPSLSRLLYGCGEITPLASSEAQSSALASAKSTPV